MLKPHLLKSIVQHSFLLCNLTQKEQEALSYGLDYHIPSNTNGNNIKTELDSSFQNFL